MKIKQHYLVISFFLVLILQQKYNISTYIFDAKSH